MKKFLVLILICAAAITSQAEKQLTAEQKTVMKEMLAKYDANKDGKLEKDEIAKMSAEDKALWKKTFPHKKKKGGESEGAGSSTNSVAPGAAGSSK